jgi:hypothetical protein
LPGSGHAESFVVTVVTAMVFCDGGTGEFIADMLAVMPITRKERQNSFFIVDLPAFLRMIFKLLSGKYNNP